MSFTKFQRTYELTMGVNPQPDGTCDEAKVTMPYSVDFTITRKAVAASQTATIRIYNLGEKTRGQMFKDENTTDKGSDGGVVFRKLVFRAGYGDYKPVIFNGYVRSCYSFRDGTNFITEIEGYDGGLDMALGYVTASNKFNNREDILKFLNSKLSGADSSPIISSMTEAEAKKSSPERVVVLCGNVWDLIQTYSDGKAFMDGGKLVVLADDAALSGEIPQISSSSGLLGSPKRGKNKIDLEMLFEPRLLPGQRINLKSTTNKWFNGDYRVAGFTHTGMISPSVNGDCRTSVTLWGPQEFRIVGGNAQTLNTN